MTEANEKKSEAVPKNVKPEDLKKAVEEKLKEKSK